MLRRSLILFVLGLIAVLLAACGSAADGATAPTGAAATTTNAPTSAPTPSPTVVPAYRDACIGLDDVRKGMWGAAENAFMAASTSATAAISAGDLSQYPVAEAFAALAEDAAQVSLAMDEGTSDAKAVAQYNADVPLYAEYLASCSSSP